jgi:hypothetical protein
METYDTVSDAPVLDRNAHSSNGASYFVPENLRRGDEAVLDLLDIGAADAAGGHSDQDFAGRDSRDRNGFKGYASLAAVNHGEHFDGGNEFG